jgi:hypothetical protein
MKYVIVSGLIGGGLLLLLASGMWLTMFPGTSSWTPEKERRLGEVGERLHVLAFTVGNAEASPSMHRGHDLIKAKAELDSVRKENQELTAEFRGIQSRRDAIPKILKWSGVSLAVIGIIGWYAGNQSR